MIDSAYAFLTCHYRSAVNEITEEYLSALDRQNPQGYDFDLKTSFEICRLTLRDKFMPYGWMNYLYHQGELETFRKKHCCKCMYKCPTCQRHCSDIERCWQREQDRIATEHYAKIWNDLDSDEK